MSLSYTKLVGRDASFQLIRTNPKLTSNVKLSVDSSENIWLSSIPADAELAKDQYQKYAIDVTKSHEYNIFKFYNNGKTPNSLAFKIGSTITQTVTARDLKNQYEFDYYTSGAKYLTSKQYDEKFSYFAPMYLNKIIPDSFVIFKVKGASNYTAGQMLAQQAFDKKQFTVDFFKNFQLVKAFDMGPETKVGKYLESILENPMFPASPLAINFNTAVNSYSYYRGISIKSGTYVQMPVDTNSVLTRGLPILKKEQFIVSGFEKNNIVHPNIINLEFLFDDDTAEDFEFNRYFGFYCNQIDLAEFDIDLEAVFNNPNDNDQAIESVIDSAESISIPVSNDSGVKLRGKNISAQVESLSSSLIDENNLYFTYLKTKEDVHLIQAGSWNQTNQSVEFNIDDSSLDLGTLFGPGEIFSQERAVVSEVDSRSTLCAVVNATPLNGSSIKVYHTNGTLTDAGGKHDRLYFILSSASSGGSFAFNGGGEWLVNYDSAGVCTAYVSADGSPQDIAVSIVGAINELRDTQIKAVAQSNRAFIQIKPSGESFGQLMATTDSANIKLVGTLIDGIVYADGGTTFPHPIIDNGAPSLTTLPLNEIDAVNDTLLVKTSTNWSRIKRVARLTDRISELNAGTVLNSAADDFFDKGTLILQDNEVPLIAHGSIEIRKISRNKVGVFSIFEIKDFDFSINSTDYAKFDTLDLFKDFYEPVGIPTLNFRRFVYDVIGTGTVSVNGVVYETGEQVWQDTNSLQEYYQVTGDCVLIKSNLSPNAFELGSYIELGQIDPTAPPAILNLSAYVDLATTPNRDNELTNYSGQFSIRTPQFNTAETPTFAYRDKFTQGVVSSEYLVNLEHQSTEFAIDNRLTPYICKWAIKDSTDVRSNPYRLNTDLVFGRDNFGPSHTEVFPSAEKLTHEWFFIESDFGFSENPELAFQNISYFEESFDIAQFKTSSTYFDEYFAYVPKINGEQIDRVQLRYSDLIRDPYSGQYETVFKGAKYRFFELDENRIGSGNSPVNSIKSNTQRFADYRFSTILKTVPDTFGDNEPPVTFEIIENTDAKAIVVVVLLRLAGVSEIHPSASVVTVGTPAPVFDRPALLSVTQSGVSLYEKVYGDYRVDFNDADVSNLTYAFLYFAKNKKYNIGDTSYSTTRLAKNVDISYTGFDQTSDQRSRAFAIEIPANSGYDVPLVSQVAIVPEAYSPLVYKSAGQTILISDGAVSSATSETSISDVQQDTIFFTAETMYAIEISASGATLVDSVLATFPTGSPLQWKNSAVLYQINGGKGYYNNLFQYFSFSNFKYLLDNKEQVITWKSYTGGNESILRKFTMRVQDYSTVKLTTQTTIVPAKVSYTNNMVTGGYTYSETAMVAQEIHRYSGEYDVIFKPVSAFYQTTKVGDFEINGANCTLHIGVPGSFEIKEFNHIKYSPARILDLENSAAYLPVYPIINETPVGTAPFNVLATSWDKGYHFEYTNKNSRFQVFGTKRITEDYSFVSKLVNVPQSLYLESFAIGTVTQAQYKGNTFVNVIDWADYSKSIRFKVDLVQAFATNFKNAGLLAEFEKFFVNGSTTITASETLMGELTLSEYTEAYAKKNLQRLYKVDEIQIWQKVDKTIPNGTIVIEEKTLDQLIAGGYSQSKSVQINNQNSSLLEGSIDRPINSGVRISFRIKIKFI